MCEAVSSFAFVVVLTHCVGLKHFTIFGMPVYQMLVVDLDTFLDFALYLSQNVLPAYQITHRYQISWAV